MVLEILQQHVKSENSEKFIIKKMSNFTEKLYFSCTFNKPSREQKTADLRSLCARIDTDKKQ